MFMYNVGKPILPHIHESIYWMPCPAIHTYLSLNAWAFLSCHQITTPKSSVCKQIAFLPWFYNYKNLT